MPLICLVPSFGGVATTQLQRVHAQLRAQFVDDRLCGKGRRRRSRRAIGGGLRLVDYNVVGLHPCVRKVVCAENALGCSPDGRPRVRAALVNKKRFRRCNLSFSVSAAIFTLI